MRKIVTVTAVVALIAAVIVAYLAFIQRTRYDAAIIAAAETEMWKAYYAKDPRRLARELYTLQRGQFGLSAFQVAFITRDLATAATVFIDKDTATENDVLPHLIKAYEAIGDASSLDFDPEEAARAELAWWTARRNRQTRAPEQVGEEITQLYAVLYGKRTPEMERAGLLRAQAAHLRDTGGADADWPRIRALLEESYTELAKVVT